MLGLGEVLREEVLPAMGRREGREHAGEAGAGGDVTFAIDEVAEARLERHLAEHAPAVAFYSEDRGLVEPAPGTEPEWVLVVDPIDGTRPAMAGLESACVSIAAAPWQGDGPGPLMRDVEVGLIVEILSGRRFFAVRGEGVEPAPELGTTTEIERMLWTYGFRGRPVVATAIVIEELIDASSVAGGTFDLGSACFDMTRVLTGQMDAYVEPGPRIIDEVEGMRGGVRARRPRRRPQQLALRPRRRCPDPRGGRRRRHRRDRRARSAIGRCSAPATSSRCRASPPPTPSSTAASSPPSIAASSDFAAAAAEWPTPQRNRCTISR